MPEMSGTAILDTNLTALFARAGLASTCIERGYGRIVNIASLKQLFVALSEVAAYAASRPASPPFTRHSQLSVEKGVTVNAIDRVFRTELTLKLLDKHRPRGQETSDAHTHGSLSVSTEELIGRVYLGLTCILRHDKCLVVDGAPPPSPAMNQ